MIVASIDIGTNTVLLLIAEVNKFTGKIIPLINEYRMPRIGQEIKQTGIISNRKLALLYDVLSEYDKIIKKHKCEKIIVSGTNAFRIAGNTSDIIREIKDKFNYDLNVISGEEEAEYAYLGAISNISRSTDLSVIDIGGSSTEIIYGKCFNIISKKSLQLGSVTGTENFLRTAPPNESEIMKFKDEILKLFSTINMKFIPEQIIAIAGTATTLVCMKSGLREFQEDKVDNSLITIGEIENIIKDLMQLNPAEILNKYGSVMRGREDIIFAGAFILYQFIKYFGIKNVIVSTRGIRYGAIIKYIKSSG
jgi:exopolyphosphatase/guanosine-5'-triphosphate,3'-diphosphate pyrophosphatase